MPTEQSRPTQGELDRMRAKEDQHQERVRAVEFDVAHVSARVESLSRGLDDFRDLFVNNMRDLKKDMEAFRQPTNWGWIIAGVMVVMTMAAMYTNLTVAPLRTQMGYILERQDGQAERAAEKTGTIGAISQSLEQVQAHVFNQVDTNSRVRTITSENSVNHLRNSDQIRSTRDAVKENRTQSQSQNARLSRLEGRMDVMQQTLRGPSRGRQVEGLQ